MEYLFCKYSKSQQVLTEVTAHFQINEYITKFDRKKFYSRQCSQKTSNALQVLMLLATYYINMCKGTLKHLTFLEYKINSHSLFQRRREIAIQRNELQNFLEAGHH